jgi:hypothetical protein
MDVHILRDAASKAIDWKREAEEKNSALEIAREDVVVSKATAADYLARSEKFVFISVFWGHFFFFCKTGIVFRLN